MDWESSGVVRFDLGLLLQGQTRIATVMFPERGIRDISRVLVLTRNSVYSVRPVEDAIPHVYKIEVF